MQYHCIFSNTAYSALSTGERSRPIADRRHSRSARTEAAIVAAATRLFAERGYARTSLAEVAEEAGVSERTLYLRFDGKAALLKRVVDVAVVGDTQEVALADRDWVAVAMSAPSLHERIDALADGSAAIQARLAPVVAVALEVESSEPVIAELAARARAHTLSLNRSFWQRARDDGLIRPDADVEWLGRTTALLVAAESGVYLIRSVGLQGYADLVRRALRALAAAP